MNLYQKFTQHLSWSFYGVLLAIVFGAITIYAAFFWERSARLTYSIQSDASVIDLKENIKELSIIYKGKDIQEAEENIRLYIIEVRNTGNAPILKGYFDQSAPWGLNSSLGTIYNPEIIASSSSYLKENLKLTNAENELIFSPVILEDSEYFTIRFLLIHPIANMPKLTATGKVATVGQPEIVFVRSETDESFWSRVIDGEFLVHLARAPLYFFVTFFGMMIVMVPFAIISDSREKKNRKKTIQEYTTKYDSEITEFEQAILDLYMNYGRILVRELAYARRWSNEAYLERAEKGSERESDDVILRRMQRDPEHLERISVRGKIAKTIKEYLKEDSEEKKSLHRKRLNRIYHHLRRSNDESQQDGGINSEAAAS